MLERYTFAALLLFPSLVTAQVPQDAAAYDAWKATLATPQPAVRNLAPPPIARPKGGGQTCDCWVEPDSSYVTVLNDSMWNAGGNNNMDDGGHGPIALPFSFTFFGLVGDSIYINVNGNLSLGGYLGGFSSTGFPASGFNMVAPFWADVDLAGVGIGINSVKYKVTPTALYVNWSQVGYFNDAVDKLNNFQVIITDGLDPAIPFGNNVSFCYKDMQWTTGDASGGTLGFGGTPASVGVNLANGVDFAQIGRFDAPGSGYDGPFLGNDQVDWLDSTHFYLNTMDPNGVPPIFASTYGCDTIVVEVGQLALVRMLILAGGPGELVSATAQCATLSSFQQLNNPVADNIEVLALIDPQVQDIGIHLVSYQAQNDDPVPLESTYKLHVRVVAGATGVSGPNSRAFSLSPNPAGEHVDVVRPTGGLAQVDLLELDGRLIRSEQHTGDRLRFDLNDLVTGTYLIRVVSGGGTNVQRFVHSSRQ